MSPPRAPEGVVSRGTVVIDVERCKGCELCIPACRPGVLSMSDAVNGMGYRYPVLVAGCTACQACHAVCPDFVFEVYRFDTPVVTPVDEAPGGASSGNGPSGDRPSDDRGAG